MARSVFRPITKVRVHASSKLYNICSDKENTESTVGADGWIHTGDVAEIDECGRVKIIDRVKVYLSFQPSDISDIFRRIS